MTDSKIENSNLEGGRLTVRHFLYLAVLFCLGVIVWAFFKKPMAGVGAFCAFVGMLLPAWQLSSQSSVHAVQFKDLDRDTKISLYFALAGVVLTAIGYWIGLNIMFTE
ncbi:hypothetical protein [Pseudomonas sp. AB12(2023)]|uniref:hypothetical protein n=1 Tax=Pseudomonas sp. AB12(2023) TaxID=3048597 RepID=UPI002B22F6C9|nr:hypothetical protein [Pseudomonas sp. AB12(2023)]MEB0221358.1 hypothetical protein [Pseudomonas sp. AB12(2023)]